MTFTGKLLRRGFWLYVWDIREADRQQLYVGRTGDTSSPNASSPFRRIGQHLEAGVRAKGNAMHRQLTRCELNPEACTFEMTAIGPLFEEQKTMDEHKPFRDRTASLEGALAEELKRRGYEVLGHHPRSTGSDPGLLAQIIAKLDAVYPSKHMRPDFDFEPILLAPGSPMASEIVIRDRGER